MSTSENRKLKGLVAAGHAGKDDDNRLQEEMDSSMDRYRTILEEMDCGYYEVDAKGKLSFINDAAARLNGYTREEMVGMSYKEYVPQQYWESTFESYARVFSTGVPLRNCPMVRLKKDGSLIYHEDFVFPVRNGKGEITGLRGIARDVTLQKLAEAALLDEKRFSEALIDSLPGIFYLIDEEGAFVRYNSNASEVVGYSPEEGKKIRAMDVIAEEDRAYIAEKLSEIFNQGSGDAEVRLLAKDGRRIPYHITAKRVSLGGRNYLLGTGVDISQRVEAERARDESEKNYRLLAENTKDIVTIVDKNFNLVWLSASGEKLTGYSFEEQKKMPLNKKIMPDSVKRTKALLIRALQEEQEGTHDPARHYDIEIELCRNDGSTIWTENQMQFTRDGNGRATAMLIQGRDISERKQAEQALKESLEELRRSNEELEQFAYVASHDLQEPLRMVSSYVQLLEKRYKDRLDSDALDFMNYAVSGARRMQNLINDLLAYSRVGTRGKPFAPVDASEVLYAALSNLEVAIHEAEAVIEHGDLPVVFGDEGQLIQVFQNIIVNAIKFHGHQPPYVRVDAVPDDGDWLFSIRDNGIGIDPQFFERIFLVFQRLNGSGYAGTGIGLSVARKIIQRHGGRIWLESQPGQGSTFYFTLPMREEGELSK
ncbi:MAG: PAS domain S-box protein [Dehalococcoidia bacterium]|nr:PAS domain S-box protein [Dehalococcoidia bacterium]